MTMIFGPLFHLHSDALAFTIRCARCSQVTISISGASLNFTQVCVVNKTVHVYHTNPSAIGYIGLCLRVG